MAIAVAVLETWVDKGRLHVIGTMTFSSSYATGGDTASFADAAIKSTRIPDNVVITPVSSATEAWIPRYVNGTTKDNGKVFVNAASTGAELAAAAYPAGITGVATKFHAIFKKFI